MVEDPKFLIQCKVNEFSNSMMEINIIPVASYEVLWIQILDQENNEVANVWFISLKMYQAYLLVKYF